LNVILYYMSILIPTSTITISYYIVVWCKLLTSTIHDYIIPRSRLPWNLHSNPKVIINVQLNHNPVHTKSSISSNWESTWHFILKAKALNRNFSFWSFLFILFPLFSRSAAGTHWIKQVWEYWGLVSPVKALFLLSHWIFPGKSWQATQTFNFVVWYNERRQLTQYIHTFYKCVSGRGVVLTPCQRKADRLTIFSGFSSVPSPVTDPIDYSPVRQVWGLWWWGSLWLTGGAGSHSGWADGWWSLPPGGCWLPSQAWWCTGRPPSEAACTLGLRSISWMEQ